MAIIYFGSPALAVPPLKALIAAGEEVAIVVTQPDARRGRGGRKSPSPVKAAALEYGIKSMEPRSIRDDAFIAELSSYKPEFLVVVAYGKLLPPEVLAIPSIAPVNLHASLLPKYRGAAPINWAIIDGQSRTGLTTMIMSEGLDEGDTLLTQQMEICNDDTVATLSARMSEAGGGLLVRTLEGLRSGAIKPTAQEGEPSYARLFTKDDGIIDWDMLPHELCNRIRGMYPWPGMFCYISGMKLKVNMALAVLDCPHPGAPGEVLESGTRLVVACGGGCVELTEVQSEGKRPMGAGDFLRGHNIKTGMVFE